MSSHSMVLLSCVSMNADGCIRDFGKEVVMFWW